MDNISPISLHVPDLKSTYFDNVLPGASIIDDANNFKALKVIYDRDLAHHNYKLTNELPTKIKKLMQITLHQLVEKGKIASTNPNLNTEEIAILGLTEVFDEISKLKEQIEDMTTGPTFNKLKRRYDFLIEAFDDLTTRHDKYFANMSINRRIAILNG